MDHIQVKGYKSLRDVKLKFAPINILIGSNGSGKSNFLSFFEFLNSLYERNLKEYVSLRGGQDRMLFQGGKITASIYCKIDFGLNGYSFELKRGDDDAFIFTSEGLWYAKNPYISNPTNISEFGTEANIKQKGTERAKYIRSFLASYKKYHFHDTSKDSPFTNNSSIVNDIHFLYERGENLAAFLYHIKEKSRVAYARIVETIQSISPFFSDFYLVPNNEGFVRLQWKDKYGSTTYGPTDFSDGTLRFIALATLFLQPSLPETIIIDEPELGLHPFAISKLAGMMQSVAQRNTQVIVATQSVDLLNHFQAEDIVTVDQRNGETKLDRLNSDDLTKWIEEYRIGELWQRNIIEKGQPR